MEVACGHGNLEAVVVGRHAVRKAKDRVNVRELRGILFSIDLPDVSRRIVEDDLCGYRRPHKPPMSTNIQER
jgi:hypothetical protein